jgi:hypothetical protein
MEGYVLKEARLFILTTPAPFMEDFILLVSIPNGSM